MMNDTLITFETAKLAKEKGFSGLCSNVYPEKGIVDELVYYEGDGSGKTTNQDLDTQYFNESYGKILCTASTQSLLAKWLREVHNIHIYIIPEIVNADEPFTYFVKIQTYNCEIDNCWGKTYEEALEIGLQESLKLIK